MGLCTSDRFDKKPGVVKVTYEETAGHYGGRPYVLKCLSGEYSWPEDGSYWYTGVYRLEGHLNDPDVKLVWDDGSRGIAVIRQFGTLWFADVDMNTGCAITTDSCQPVKATDYERKLAEHISTVSGKQANVAESRELFSGIGR